MLPIEMQCDFDFEDVNAFIEKCEASNKLNAKTLKAYGFDLKEYSDFSGGILNVDSISDYIKYLHEKFTPSTARRKLVSLRLFTNHLLEIGIIEDNPFNKMNTVVKIPPSYPQSVTSETIQELLAAADSNYENAPTEYQKNAALRNLALLKLIVSTGLKVSETSRLNIENVDWKNNIITTTDSAKQKRAFKIDDDVMTTLKIYYERFKPEIEQNECFFINRFNNRLSEQSIRFMVKKYIAETNYSGHVTPKILRHSIIKMLLEDNEVRYVQGFSGHKSVISTERYVEFSDEIVYTAIKLK
ncbi:MAG: tyrosine-type recombinase/integrase [Oscillospiraceae bacterium]|nr:tyrosine-type recombinase/integrase [Oscillospiraceae bacterium]